MALPPFPHKIKAVNEKIAVDWFNQLTSAINSLSINSPSGNGAPTAAQYVTLATDATLSAERVLTAGEGITITDAGAGGAVTVSAQEVKQRSWMGF